MTIACEGGSIKCHKIVLSASSAYFEKLFLENSCEHPIVFLKVSCFPHYFPIILHTVCPRSIYPYYIVTYYMKWVTFSWTHSIDLFLDALFCKRKQDIYKFVGPLSLFLIPLGTFLLHPSWN